MVRASAPGKVILLGEHAVVYGRPALAAPVSQLRATATVEATPPGSGLTLVALDLERRVTLEQASLEEPLGAIALLTLAHLDLPSIDAVLTVQSNLPIAGGLGSGAAVSAAIVRAIAAFVGANLSPAEVSQLVFEVEKLHHGTPSGIDNTVIAYERPVYFVPGGVPETFSAGVPLHFLIAISGVASPTRQVVAMVRQRWQAAAVHYDFLFDRIGDLVEEAHEAIEAGDPYTLGSLMDQNHELLREMGVSAPELEALVEAAQIAEALGAKLSGAGHGGNVIVLTEEDLIAETAEALMAAGATQVIHTIVE